MKFDLRASWVPLIRRLPQAKGRVALSFDDGPAAETTPTIIELLRRHNAHATFFMLGERAERHPELVAALVAAGHSVFAHGWEHVRLDHAGPANLVASLTRTEELLRRFRPAPAPYIVRLPYAGGYRNPVVHRALRAWNPSVQIAHWSHHFGDPELAKASVDRADLERRAGPSIDGVLDSPTLDGGVVLLHEMAADIEGPMRAETPLHLLERFLGGLQARGLACCAIEPLPSPPWHGRFLLR